MRSHNGAQILGRDGLKRFGHTKTGQDFSHQLSSHCLSSDRIQSNGLLAEIRHKFDSLVLEGLHGVACLSFLKGTGNLVEGICDRRTNFLGRVITPLIRLLKHLKDLW